jgi:hypothetical protein
MVLNRYDIQRFFKNYSSPSVRSVEGNVKVTVPRYFLTSVYISSNLSTDLNRHARNDFIFFPGVNDTGERCIIGVNNPRGLKPQAKN